MGAIRSGFVRIRRARPSRRHQRGGDLHKSFHTVSLSRFRPRGLFTFRAERAGHFRRPEQTHGLRVTGTHEASLDVALAVPVPAASGRAHADFHKAHPGDRMRLPIVKVHDVDEADIDVPFLNPQVRVASQWRRSRLVLSTPSMGLVQVVLAANAVPLGSKSVRA